jgi:hypothetical protein
MRFGLVPVLCFVGWCSACVPGVLNKYTGGGRSHEVQASTAPHAAPPKTVAKPVGETPVQARRPGIFAVDLGTFRIADRNNGLITTEWDSYYLDGKVHRNKLSMRLKRMGGSLVEVTIFNNVEVLSKLPDGGITEIWLPTDKNKAEIGRIIQNMAIAMGQPRPNLPQELMAGSVPAAEKSRL